MMMEWRPQKEGIATEAELGEFWGPLDGMETSKRRDCDHKGGTAKYGIPLDGMETSKRRDCDSHSNLNF